MEHLKTKSTDLYRLSIPDAWHAGNQPDSILFAPETVQWRAHQYYSWYASDIRGANIPKGVKAQVNLVVWNKYIDDPFNAGYEHPARFARKDTTIKQQENLLLANNIPATLCYLSTSYYKTSQETPLHFSSYYVFVASKEQQRTYVYGITFEYREVDRSIENQAGFKQLAQELVRRFIVL